MILKDIINGIEKSKTFQVRQYLQVFALKPLLLCASAESEHRLYPTVCIYAGKLS